MAKAIKIAPGIGSRIAQIRGDLSREEFARKLDMNYQTVANYERGERKPDILFFQRIHEVFRVDLNSLILDGFDGETKPINSISLVGEIDKNQIIVPFDKPQSAPGAAGLSPSACALRSINNSTRMIFEDGSLFYYENMGNIAELYGHPCVMKIKDGAIVLKSAYPSLTPGILRLYPPYGGDDEKMEAAIEWAAPIILVKPELNGPLK